YSTPHVQQFVREAVITARLQHPSIIPVYDLGFLSSNQLYYTMRYVHGHRFSELIGRIEMNEQLRILRNAALAVSAAHTEGLWHRDLKPGNIMVGVAGDTYVIDWGLVSVQPGRSYKLNLPEIVIGHQHHLIPDNLMQQTSEALTDSGLFGRIGTPQYMSPEQFANNDSKEGVVSDVWA